MPTAAASAVRQQIASGTPDPVYLLFGDDEVEKAALVGAGGVEHDMGEAEIDGLGQTLDVLVGVAGHDPAARGAADGQGVGELFHLHRVLDAGFFLRRQGERRPVPRVLERTLAVGIALFSYCDTLSWGFSADWDEVPDLHELVTATERSFEELCRVAGV